jgi:hypothetical protein
VAKKFPQRNPIEDEFKVQNGKTHRETIHQEQESANLKLVQLSERRDKIL